MNRKVSVGGGISSDLFIVVVSKKLLYEKSREEGLVVDDDAAAEKVRGDKISRMRSGTPSGREGRLGLLLKECW